MIYPNLFPIASEASELQCQELKAALKVTSALSTAYPSSVVGASQAVALGCPNSTSYFISGSSETTICAGAMPEDQVPDQEAGEADEVRKLAVLKGMADRLEEKIISEKGSESPNSDSSLSLITATSVKPFSTSSPPQDISTHTKVNSDITDLAFPNHTSTTLFTPISLVKPIILQLLLHSFLPSTCLVPFIASRGPFGLRSALVKAKAELEPPSQAVASRQARLIDDALLQETIRTFQALIQERDSSILQLRATLKRQQQKYKYELEKANLDVSVEDDTAIQLVQLAECAVQTELDMVQAGQLAKVAEDLMNGGVILSQPQWRQLLDEMGPTHTKEDLLYSHGPTSSSSIDNLSTHIPIQKSFSDTSEIIKGKQVSDRNPVISELFLAANLMRRQVEQMRANMAVMMTTPSQSNQAVEHVELHVADGKGNVLSSDQDDLFV
ncbi:unnamed protein product [Protopolystoma xenopodis]|uniref:Uncharacterized protein n=1 Tax=Protopolystoma xenopodis TaxID=117903 RepID=A0A3S4ZS58_9PLAT|nr:unnamed protein product [Protopolystoma xenopodis]